MNILFLGGDKRYKYMMSDLTSKHKVYQIGFNHIEGVKEINISNINISTFDIVIFPISGLSNNQEIKSEQGVIYIPNKFFLNSNKETKFFTGIKTPKLLEYISESQLISFLDFDEVIKINNELTIERGNSSFKRSSNEKCLYFRLSENLGKNYI